MRQHAWNYLASLLARENGIIKTTTVLKCLQIVLAKQEDPEEILKADRADSISSSSSQTSASECDKRSKGTSQETLFTHCFIQGLTQILAARHSMLQREDPHLFTQVCMLVFKKHFRSSLIYCSPVILGDLLRATKHSKTGLHVFKSKVNELFRA